MPRINPISKHDREIATRIKDFRRRSKCTRTFLAERIGVTSATITRIELGRMPLKYELAQDIFSCLGINPYWAATGNGSPNGYVYLPSTIALKAPYNGLFSDIFSAHLLQLFENKKISPTAEIVLRYQRGKLAAKLVETWFRDVPDGHVGEFEKYLDKARSDFFSKCPAESPDKILQRRLWYESFAKEFEQRIKRYGSKYDLTDAATSEKLSEVKAQLPSLLERLNKTTKESGRMSDLADYLKVPLASVSRWLSGKREPGGEVTLRLLKWVEQQERQK